MKLGLSHDNVVNAMLIGGFGALMWGLWAIYWPLAPLVGGTLMLALGCLYALWKAR